MTWATLSTGISYRLHHAGHVETEIAHGFNGFSKVASSGWLPRSGFPGFRKRIQRAEIVIPQAFDNESFFRALGGRWIPGGFPGESACR